MAENKQSRKSGGKQKELQGSEQVRFNFIGNMRYGFMLSGTAMVLALIGLFVVGLNYGIDFKGGSIFHYHFDNSAVSEDTIRNILENSSLKKDLGQVIVQRVIGEIDLGLPGAAPSEDKKKEKKADSGVSFIIHTEYTKEVSESEDIEPKIHNLFENASLGSFQLLKREFIGPTVGAMLRSKALWALIISIFGIMMYISMRFEFSYAVAAVAALVHDTLFVLGVFAFLQRDVTIAIMAALLTIIGYSLNDTIVILDRIRENNRLKARLPFDFRVNLSINQSLSRTINTSVTTLLAVLALLLLGGPVIRGFALAMTIGVVVGTYSSIFIVSPILVLWYYRDHPSAPKAVIGG